MLTESDRLMRLKRLHASAALQEATGCSPLASLRAAGRLSDAELDQLWAARPAPRVQEIATRLWLRAEAQLAAAAVDLRVCTRYNPIGSAARVRRARGRRRRSVQRA